MEPSLINLLPGKRIRAFRREYFFRLVTTALALLVALVLLHGILLIPAYTYLNEQLLTGNAQLAALAQMRTPAQQAISDQLVMFEKNASRLRELDTNPEGSDIMRAVLQTAHPDLLLSGFTYTPAVASGSYKLVISGTAKTREALRQYDNALSSLPFIHSVDLPINAYAKETNISFALTLTGTKP